MLQRPRRSTFLNRPFTIIVHTLLIITVSNRLVRRSEGWSRREENVLSSAPASAVINLVHQAAEVFSSMEDHARETEARAQSLCKSALERLELTEKRIETVERERREAINKLRDASKALEEAQLRAIAVEDRLTAADAMRLGTGPVIQRAIGERA